MKQYLLRRLTMLLLVLSGVIILSFALIGLFGRDPAEVIARRTNTHATCNLLGEKPKNLTDSSDINDFDSSINHHKCRRQHTAERIPKTRLPFPFWLPLDIEHNR